MADALAGRVLDGGPVKALTRRNGDRLVPVAGLLVLSPIGAELLSAYDDSTGRPGQVLFAIAFFALLYGCPALLIRELVRRTGRGWTAMLTLTMAAGLLQAGVLDQSLFADRYDGIADWDTWLHGTYIAPLGIGAYLAQSFVLGHVVYSFGAPIAIAEAWRPGLAGRPWLRARGLAAALLGWALAAGAIVADTLGGGGSHATATEVVVTLAVIAVLVALALGPRPRPRPRGEARGAAARPRTILVASLVATGAYALCPTSWLGVGLALLVAAVGGALLLHASRAPGWGLPHATAIAAGALLSRGLLAFSYFPVVGETPALQKYAHNATMLLVVGAASAYALRRAAGTAVAMPASRGPQRVRSPQPYGNSGS